MDVNKPISVPVLLLAFNKPDKTIRVFDIIRKVKPKKLYVAVDGPRADRPDDKEKCNRVREIVQQVDWECEKHYLFQEENLGCSRSGKASWDWVFSREEEIIFLEDDGVASISFFWFAQELLEKYRNDQRIAYIGGINYGITKGRASYFFTRSGSGSYVMAFWKRTYDLYEYKLESYKETINNKEFINAFPDKLAYKIRKKNFEHYLKHGGETYDIQSIFLLNKYNMYCIVPNINMGTNIGWDNDGTNSICDPNSKTAKKYGNQPRFELREIIHPEEFQIEKKFEKKYFRYRYWNDRTWVVMAFRFYIRQRLVANPVLKRIYHYVKGFQVCIN